MKENKKTEGSFISQRKIIAMFVRNINIDIFTLEILSSSSNNEKK